MVEDRPKVYTRSERVVVDSISSDGTVRLLRAGRRRTNDSKSFNLSMWKKEKEHEVPLEALRALLADELEGRQIHEGDVFFIHDGPAFFNKRLQRLLELLGEQQKETTSELLQSASLESERLILPVEEAKSIARQEIKAEFSKLIAAQGVTDSKARTKLKRKTNKAIRQREEMERTQKNSSK